MEDENTPPARRRSVRAVSLVAAGLLAGGALAGTVSAQASGPDASPASTAENGREAPGGTGSLTAAAAGDVIGAVLEEYPDAEVKGVSVGRDGGYVARVDDDGEHLHLEIDSDLNVTESEGPRGRMGHGPGRGGPGGERGGPERSGAPDHEAEGDRPAPPEGAPSEEAAPAPGGD